MILTSDKISLPRFKNGQIQTAWASQSERRPLFFWGGGVDQLVLLAERTPPIQPGRLWSFQGCLV